MNSDLYCKCRFLNPSISTFRDTDLKLHIYVGRYFFSFSISSIDSNKILAIASYEFSNSEIAFSDNIKRLVKHESLLSPDFKYKVISYSVESFNSTIIPNTIYKEKEIVNYLKTLFFTNSNEHIVSEKEDHTLSRILSMLNPSFRAYIRAIYPNSNYKSIYKILINLIYSIKQDKKNTHTAVLNLRKKDFDLIIKNNSNLVFINTFKYKNIENLLYYFLYTFNKLEIDMGSVSLHLLGLSREENLCELLRKYVFHTSYMQAKSEIILPKGVNYDEFLITLNQF